MIAPTGIYFDEVSSTTIVASAYAATPAFIGLETGLAGVVVALNNVYKPWRNGNTWTTKAPMPTARAYFSGGAISGKLYALGGALNSSPIDTNTNEEYDPAINTWTTKMAMPTARYNLSVEVVGGKLYALGGTSATSNFLTINEEFDPIENTWMTKTAMPTGRADLAVGVVGGKIYTLGGDGGANTNEEYDPASNSWATKAAMPTARTWLAAGVIDSKLYVMGGNSGSAWANTNEEYNPVSNTWQTKAVMPTPRAGLSVIAIGKKLYAVGGFNSAYMNTNEEYDPAVNIWTTKAVMTTPRHFFSAGVIGGKLYAIGGQSNGGFLSTNEEYDPGVAATFTGLIPNTQYTFKAKARDTSGIETLETPTISTYTLATVAMPVNGYPFATIYASSITINWSSGTAIGGFNGPDASYLVQIATMPSFQPVLSSSATKQLSAIFPGLYPNATYYFRAQAYNTLRVTDYSWLVLGSTVILPNQSPTLTWTGETDYISDGLTPETSTPSISFAYRVKYTDADNDAPAAGSPKVHIQKGGAEITGSPFTMSFVSGAYTTGAIYTYSKTLSATGSDYTYSFEAQDVNGASATGTPTNSIDAPDVVSGAPTLSWTGEADYVSDGLDLQTGNSPLPVVFRVKYTDPDNDAPLASNPKVHIKAGGVEISGSPFAMNYVSGTNNTGSIYTCPRTLNTGAYVYYFEASDLWGTTAPGQPTAELAGPIVVGPTVVPPGAQEVKVYHSVFKPGQDEKTSISFNTTIAATVTITVYNNVGRKVRELYRGTSTSGINFIQWDGRDEGGSKVSSGVYTIKIEGGGISQSKRVVVVR